MMNAIQTWVAGAGFDSILIFAGGSTFIFLIAFVANGWFWKRSAACRFNVWQTAFISLLLLPAGQLVLPEFPLGFGDPMVATNPILFERH